MGFGFLNLIALEAILDELTKLLLVAFMARIPEKSYSQKNLIEIKSTHPKIFLHAKNFLQKKKKKDLETRKME